MKPARQCFAWIVGIAAVLATITARADTVYLKSGRVIKVDKAWEEDGRVKYQIGEGIASVPKSSVDRIETDRAPLPTPRSATPPVKSNSAGISGPRGSRQIYFVPLGLFPESDLQALVAYCQKRFHIKVNVLPSVTVDKAAIDQERGQLISEELNASMRRALPALAQDRDAVLIGFTKFDMYPRSENWQFAYGWREQGSAVISTARFRIHYPGEPREAMPEVRLRKVVIKDIGLLYYGLELSDNPASVLYSGIMGIQELDQVTENF